MEIKDGRTEFSLDDFDVTITFRNLWVYGYLQPSQAVLRRKTNQRIFSVIIYDTRLLPTIYPDMEKCYAQLSYIVGKDLYTYPSEKEKQAELAKVRDCVEKLDDLVRGTYPGYGIIRYKGDQSVDRIKDIDWRLKNIAANAREVVVNLKKYNIEWVVDRDCWTDMVTVSLRVFGVIRKTYGVNLIEVMVPWKRANDLKEEIKGIFPEGVPPFPQIPKLALPKLDLESFPALLVESTMNPGRDEKEELNAEELNAEESNAEESKAEESEAEELNYEEINENEPSEENSDGHPVFADEDSEYNEESDYDDDNDYHRKKDKRAALRKAALLRRKRKKQFLDRWGEVIEKEGLDGFIKEATEEIRFKLSGIDQIELTDQNVKRLAEFLAYFYRTEILDGYKLRREQRGYYNLMIITPDPDIAECVSTRVAEVLEFPRHGSGHFVVADWEEILVAIRRRGEVEAAVRKLDGNSELSPQDSEQMYQALDDLLSGLAVMLINRCRAIPEENPDSSGTGSAKEENKNNRVAEILGWNAVIRYAERLEERERGDLAGAMLIISAHPDVIRNSLKKNTELYYRAFGHRVIIPDRTAEQVKELCFRRIRDISIPFSTDFEEKLSDYFDVVYPKAELRGMRFIEDLRDRIVSRYWSRVPDGEGVIDTSCIPHYRQNADSPDSILGRLNDMIGLERVKEMFRSIYKEEVLRLQENGLKTRRDRPFHMIFTGNPGTGKTTVAKLTTDLFFAMNIIEKKNLVVTNPSDFQSTWRSGTRDKARSVIHSAYGGVLFIDEAYGFLNGEERAQEALTILIQEMVDNSDRLIVIFAGYEKEMEEFLKMNSGIKSRIGDDHILHFDDFSMEELYQILERKCAAEGFSLDDSAVDPVNTCIREMRTRAHFGNAREMETLFDRLKKAWNEEAYEIRIQKGENQEGSPEKVFYARHVLSVMPKKSTKMLDDLVGLKVIKEQLEEFEQREGYQKVLREKGVKGLETYSRHMIFKGNPGTGKTTVARLLADTLYSIGTLSSNRIVIAERKDLVGSHVGETAQLTGDIIEKARGGILFIDEAYSLTSVEGSNDFGHEAIETLITAMEKYREDTIFIFAGYTREMDRFIESNPGIRSRIGYTFYFEDYTVDELMEIFDQSMADAGFKVNKPARDRVAEIMNYFHSVPNFGNGRFVEHVINRIINHRAGRDYTKKAQDICAKDIPGVADIIKTAPDGIRLYDPAKITKEEKLRTAIHETGHATVMYLLDKRELPKSISVVSEAESYGRVWLNTDQRGSMTEEDLIHHIAGLLGGRNAERVLLGSNASGCSEDFRRAKEIAKRMVEDYAMGELGVTTDMDFLKKADELATKVISENKTFIREFAEELLVKQEISGEEFRKMLQKKLQKKQ